MEQAINLHIKFIAKPYATDYKMPCCSGICGRPKLEFEESSKMSKRRKSKELRKTVGLPVLTNATKECLMSAGKTDAAKICSRPLETAPTGALRTVSRFIMAQICYLVLYDISKEFFSFKKGAEMPALHTAFIRNGH